MENDPLLTTITSIVSVYRNETRPLTPNVDVAREILAVIDEDRAATRSALRQLLAEIHEIDVDFSRHFDYGDGTCCECEKEWPCAVGRARVLVSDVSTWEGGDEMNDEEDEIRCDT